jgi:hypothetical protein
MAKGRRTYGRRRMNRSRRQRGGFPGDGKRFGNPCDSEKDWFCTKSTSGASQPGALAGLQQGAQNAAAGVGKAFSTLGEDLGIGAKKPGYGESVPSSAQYGDAVNRMQAPPQYGGRRRRRRTMRRRRRSSRRY